MENAQKSQGVKSKEISDFVETNHLGQVKIASTDKTGKWIWVNAKQYRGILKQRIARLKWEKTRKKRSKKKSNRALRKKHSNKSPPQACGNKKSKGKVIDDSTLYSPTSTPLTWSSDLYVKELLNEKQRLEVLEAKK